MTPGEYELSSTGHSATGTSDPIYKEIYSVCGPYIAKVRLTERNEFVDIIEIKLNADFRSTAQRVHSRGFHDVTDLYEEKDNE